MQNIPQNIRVALKEAKDLLESGGPLSAEQAREKLLELSDASQYPLYHLLLAKAARELNQRETALLHLEKSLELDGNNLQALLLVAEERIKSGNGEGGFALLETGAAIVVKNADAKTACKIAALMIKSGHAQAAINLMVFANEINPNDRVVSHILGLAYRENGELDNYERQTIAAIQLTTLDKSVRERLTLCKFYIEGNMYGKSLALLSPLRENLNIELPFKSARDIIGILYALCMMHEATGHSLQVARDCLISVQDQSSLAANYVWGRLQFAQNDLDGALKSALAIQRLSSLKIDRLDDKKMRSKEVLERNATGSLNAQAQALLGATADRLQELSRIGLLKTSESLQNFFQQAHTVFLNSLPV